MHRLLAWFELETRGSNLGRELRGEVATFLTMAYILFVNPLILKDSGMPPEVVRSLSACTATYSIAHGIGYGFITNVAIKMLCGKFAQVHALMYIVAAAFAAHFVFGTA